MRLTERNIRNSKFLMLLLTFAVLISAFCFGCSGSKKPAANDPVSEKPKAQMPEVPMDKTAARYGTVYLYSERTQEFNLYQEPANAKSPVTGKVKAGDQFRILDEKDFFVLIETEDKRKGWIFKHNVAEYFFWSPEEKKDGKQLPVPDALAVFGPSFEENPVEPAVWYEVCPKTDLDLYEFPHVKAAVVAKAKANHRYLITDTAMVGFPRLSYREFPNGSKGSHIVGLGFEDSVFYQEGRVFRTGHGSPYAAYGF